MQHLTSILERGSLVYLDNLRKDIKETKDVVADEVVVAVSVLILPGQEKRLTELARVHSRDGDRAGHHQEHTTFMHWPWQYGQRGQAQLSEQMFQHQLQCYG